MPVAWKSLELVSNCWFPFWPQRAPNDRETQAWLSTSITSLLILRTIMHRFWQIDELVRMVASDLENRCGASTSVLALACCSKRLSDIVLDILWESLEGLGFLMECLPPETWEIDDGEFVRITWVYSHLSASSPVNRCSYIAPRPRNGSDSRVMLVESTGFSHMNLQESQLFRWQHTTYYLCRPRL